VTSALAASVVIYTIGNQTVNVLLGGVIDAQVVAWHFAYVIALVLAGYLGAVIARRRQGVFDAACAARARVRGSRR
jgi:hypothetical protein